jgi:anti-sigma regulatory factor (Ser/Thr protein kinase)
MVPEARHALADWLATVGIDGDQAYALLVVVSELVTNGVLHDGGDKVTLQAQLEPDVVVLVIRTIDLPEAREPMLRLIEDPLETGRGLGIVNALSDTLEIAIDGPRRLVRCEIAV